MIESEKTRYVLVTIPWKPPTLTPELGHQGKCRL